MYKKHFGKRLKMLLHERGMTQKDLSVLLGVSSGMVSQYTAGRHFPEAKLLPVIADIFGVSVDWLGGRTTVRELLREEPSKPKKEGPDLPPGSPLQ